MKPSLEEIEQGAEVFLTSGSHSRGIHGLLNRQFLEACDDANEGMEAHYTIFAMVLAGRPASEIRDKLRELIAPEGEDYSAENRGDQICDERRQEA